MKSLLALCALAAVTALVGCGGNELSEEETAALTGANTEAVDAAMQEPMYVDGVEVPLDLIYEADQIEGPPAAKEKYIRERMQNR